MSYARARLWLGITSVGSVVLFASVLVVGGFATRWLPGPSAGFSEELRALVLVGVTVVLLGLPFDYLGGHALPARFGRARHGVGRWFRRWLRGTAVLGSAYLGLSLAVLAVAGRWGEPAGILLVVAAALAAIPAQGVLARLVGELRPDSAADRRAAEVARVRGLDPGRIVVVRSDDPGFTGGWVGWPGRERLVLPAHWVEAFDDARLGAQLDRRLGVIDSGARARGLGVALLFNLAGFALATLVPGAGLDSVAGLVQVALLVTLWSFLGALVLPSLSRPAVFAADRFAREGGASLPVLEDLISRLDRLQDDEPDRPRAVETVFHPIPAVQRRLSALAAEAAPRPGAWHTARIALYLSWACFGLLGRSVHCNCGRPELWVLLPAD